MSLLFFLPFLTAAAEQTPKAEKPPRNPQTARAFNSNGSGQAQNQVF
jgi:hypothetical protein